MSILNWWRWVCNDCLCYVTVTQLLCVSYHFKKCQIDFVFSRDKRHYMAILNWRIEFGPRLSLLSLPLYNYCIAYESHVCLAQCHVTYVWFILIDREEITSQWRFRQFYNEGVKWNFFHIYNWAFHASWSSVSVIRLARLLFWLIPYICTGEQSFRCVSLWPYSAGIVKKFRGQQRLLQGLCTSSAMIIFQF